MRKSLIACLIFSSVYVVSQTSTPAKRPAASAAPPTAIIDTAAQQTSSIQR